MADGGTVSIDYSPCPALPPAAPMVIFLHTITGSARETSHFMRYATRCPVLVVGVMGVVVVVEAGVNIRVAHQKNRR